MSLQVFFEGKKNFLNKKSWCFRKKKKVKIAQVDAFSYNSFLYIFFSAKGSGLKDRLERVTQFTGFSDPIYAEACVSVHQFDIVLDILIVNQTKSTLQVFRIFYRFFLPPQKPACVKVC